jgi:hypothetical protein
MHQKLYANVERLYFAGEATSASYYGFLQGVWFEGRELGEEIAGMIGGTCVDGILLLMGMEILLLVGLIMRMRCIMRF